MAKDVTISDFNLILQLAIFALFLAGIYAMKARKKSLRKHRVLMGIAVILNTISIFLIMGGSFLNLAGFLTSRFYEFGALVTLTHVTTGSLAQVLGILFLIKHPRKIRLVMRMATIFWAAALLLGLVFYAYFYLL